MKQQARLPADFALNRALWRGWLTLRVHLDTLRRDPRGYLQALGWRLQGKRQRARHRFAALTGQSSLAYSLWIASREAGAWAEVLPASAREPRVPFHIVVDGRADPAQIEVTLASLREIPIDGSIFVLGNRFATSLQVEWCAGPADLAAALAGRTPCWICPIPAGDQLAAGAISAYRRVAEEANAGIVYADDDLLATRGRRASPHFKPRWNPELFAGFDYLTGSAIVRLDNAEILQRAATQPDRWIEALVERLLRDGQIPHHLPLVLHHRRHQPAARQLPAPSVPASVAISLQVTVIVPTRDQGDLLRACMEGLDRTGCPARNRIVIDNDSSDPPTLRYLHELTKKGVRVMPFAGPFNFSKMNNAAAEVAQDELLCFLNNDIEILNGHWLNPMVDHAIRPDVGAVGAMLLYPDGSVQHAGVVLGIGGGAAHAHRGLAGGAPGYFQRAYIAQRVSAVTAACLVVSRDKFQAVGGFDEEAFPVAFNDVDLCLKLNARGWHTIYEPRAVLMHHESKSRGADESPEKRERFARELAALKRRWGTDRMVDPWHHPQLSRFSDSFVVDL